MSNYKFTTKWFEKTATGYWDTLKKYLVEKFGHNLNCLDVGAYEGRSAIWMADNLIGSDGSLHIIDILKDSYKDNLMFNLGQIEKQNSIKLHDGDSIIKLPILLDQLGEYFHFIYIDAGKTAADNCLNSLIAERMLKKGGLLVIDDYLWKDSSDDARLSPKLGIDLFSSLTLLTQMQNTPRTQAAFLKIFDNKKMTDANK